MVEYGLNYSNITELKTIYGMFNFQIDINLR